MKLQGCEEVLLGCAVKVLTALITRTDSAIERQYISETRDRLNLIRTIPEEHET